MDSKNRSTISDRWQITRNNMEDAHSVEKMVRSLRVDEKHRSKMLSLRYSDVPMLDCLSRGRKKSLDASFNVLRQCCLSRLL
jgi:hypothetical protein